MRVTCGLVLECIATVADCQGYPLHLSRMRGNRDAWCPRAYVREVHPGVRVMETDRLPGDTQGAIDYDRRIIWLARGLPEAAHRSTLAYEVALWEFGPPPDDPMLAAAHTRAATDWAALMLIPSDDFSRAWANCLDLEEMAARVGVDLPMFRARIRAASDADQDAAVEAIAQTRLSA